jgi:hypothetical protein
MKFFVGFQGAMVPPPFLMKIEIVEYSRIKPKPVKTIPTARSNIAAWYETPQKEGTGLN